MPKDNLNINFNVGDPLFMATFKGLLSSKWGYKGYSTRPDFVKQRLDVTSDNTFTYQGTGRFKLPKRAAVLKNIAARWVAGALVPNDPGTQPAPSPSLALSEPRFVNWAAYAALARSELFYGTKSLHTILPMQLFVQNNLYERRKDIAALGEMAGGDLSGGATGPGDSREFRAAQASGQLFTVPIPFYFTELTDKAIHTEGLGYQLEVQITLDAFLNLVDVSTPAANTPTGGGITNFVLHCEYIHIDDMERNWHINRTLDDVGIVKLFRDVQYQPRETITGTPTQYRMALRNLYGPCYELRWFLRDPLDVDGQLTGRKDYFNFLPFAYGATVGLENWLVEASGTRIIEPMDQQWNLFKENAEQHSADSGRYIFGGTFTYDTEDMRNATGHKTLAGTPNPTLEVNFGGACPASLIIDAMAFQYNNMHEKRGDIQKMLN